DPYAVVRPPAPPPPPALPERRVGGRAMLDPDEPLTDQLSRLRASASVPHPAPAQPGTVPPGEPRFTDRGVAWDRGPIERGSLDSGPFDSGPYDRSPVDRGEARVTGRRRAPSDSAVLLDQVRDRAWIATNRAGQAVSRLARRPRAKLVAGAGLAVVLVATATVALLNSRSPAPPPPPPPVASADPSPSADAPLIEAQEHVDERGFVVNVPAGWERSGNGSYVDYLDPESARKVRINVEPAGATAQRFLEVAE